MTRVLHHCLLVLLVALVAAPAQAQKGRLRTIGVLTFDPVPDEIRQAFRAGLRDNGYVEGKNILVEWRSADGQIERANAAAAEFVRLKVDVIVATPTPAVQAVKNATNTIPIVMAPAGDPIGTGFVQSLARPGGNITGLSTMGAELGGKLLGTIQQLRPGVARVAVLRNNNPFARPFLEQVEAAGSKVNVRIIPVMVQSADNLDSAFAAMARDRVEALIVQPQLATQRVADLATKHRIPTITTGIGNAYASMGGLIYYGASGTEMHRRAADYVDKILKGAKPGDLPIQLPTKMELVLNLKTAKAIGIAIPHELVKLADRVIE